MKCEWMNNKCSVLYNHNHKSWMFTYFRHDMLIWIASIYRTSSHHSIRRQWKKKCITAIYQNENIISRFFPAECSNNGDDKLWVGIYWTHSQLPTALNKNNAKSSDMTRCISLSHFNSDDEKKTRCMHVHLSMDCMHAGYSHGGQCWLQQKGLFRWINYEADEKKIGSDHRAAHIV